MCTYAWMGVQLHCSIPLRFQFHAGINRIGHDDLLSGDGLSPFQPALRLVTYLPYQPELVDSSQYP